MTFLKEINDETTIYYDRIGSIWPGRPVSWTSKDTLLYALGVGAGQENPSEELPFTTENSLGIEQQVLPTFGVILASLNDLSWLGNFPLSSILHAEQALTIHRHLPAEGTGTTSYRLVDVQDKAKGTMIEVEIELRDESSGEVLLTNRTIIFVRGTNGGNRSSSKPSTPWSAPDRIPDHVVEYHVPVDQALLYRLSGDRNPLHSDPASAEAAGFERPILHGLCTFGYAGRALLHTVGNSHPGSFGHFSARFAAPMFPGEMLRTLIWAEPGGAVFQSYVRDRLILDRGEFKRWKA